MSDDEAPVERALQDSISVLVRNHNISFSVRTIPKALIIALYASEAEVVEGALGERRKEFLMGRLCAREALAQLNCQAGPILTDADRVPIWPSGYVGSISHTPNHCAAIVSSETQWLSLGLDIEPIVELSEAEAKLVLNAHDTVIRDGNVPTTITTFVAKEAFYKAYFPITRTFLDFKDVAISLSAKPGGEFTATLLPDNAPRVHGRSTFQGVYIVDSSHVVAIVAMSVK